MTGNGKGKQFDQGTDKLCAKFDEELEEEVEECMYVSQLLPACWQVKKHDKGLLKAVSKNGF